MTTYVPGDYVKVEFKNETGESEWMWVKVDFCDDKSKLLFGWLDSEPLIDHGSKVRLGSHLAVSYANVREHKKTSGSK